jgi:hypothetical protein
MKGFDVVKKPIEHLPKNGIVLHDQYLPHGNAFPFFR